MYTGPRPATGGAVTTLLAELVLSDPSGTVSNGVFTFSAITADAAADANGTAAWFRIVDSNNAFVMDGDLTATGGGGDITINTTSIVQNAQVSVTSFTITEQSA
jgi:hypothetical protein